MAERVSAAFPRLGVGTDPGNHSAGLSQVSPGPAPTLRAWWGTHSGVGVCSKQALGCFLLKQVAGSARAACGGFAQRPQRFLAASLGLCHCGSAAPAQGSRATRCRVASLAARGRARCSGQPPPGQVTSFIKLKDKNERERVGCFLSELQTSGGVSS